MSNRKQQACELKAKVALEALKGEAIVPALASRFGVYPSGSVVADLKPAGHGLLRRGADQGYLSVLAA